MGRASEAEFWEGAEVVIRGCIEAEDLPLGGSARYVSKSENAAAGTWIVIYNLTRQATDGALVMLVSRLTRNPYAALIQYRKSWNRVKRY